MDEMINKAINLGIGAVLAVKEGLKSTATNIQDEVNTLIAKGEGTDSQQAAKVREFADKAIDYLNNLQVKAQETGGNIKAQVEPLINQAKEQIEKIRGQKSDSVKA